MKIFNEKYGNQYQLPVDDIKWQPELWTVILTVWNEEKRRYFRSVLFYKASKKMNIKTYEYQDNDIHYLYRLN